MASCCARQIAGEAILRQSCPQHKSIVNRGEALILKQNPNRTHAVAGRGVGLGPATVAEPCLGAGLQPRWDMTAGGAAGAAGPWGWCKGHRRVSVPAAGASPAHCVLRGGHGPILHSAACGCQRSVTHPWLLPIRSLVLLFVIGSCLSSSLCMSWRPKLNHYELTPPVRFPQAVNQEPWQR